MDKQLSKGSIINCIWELVQPIATSLGLEIWDIKYLKEGSTWYLRVFIDKPDGITLQDCEKMSRAIDPPIDELDPIKQAYCLEVCSPGIERTLERSDHFERYLGQGVIVKLIRADNSGEREYKGTLKQHSKQSVVILQASGDEKTISRKDTAFVKADDFNIGRGNQENE